MLIVLYASEHLTVEAPVFWGDQLVWSILLQLTIINYMEAAMVDLIIWIGLSENLSSINQNMLIYD